MYVLIRDTKTLCFTKRLSFSCFKEGQQRWQVLAKHSTALAHQIPKSQTTSIS